MENLQKKIAKKITKHIKYIPLHEFFYSTNISLQYKYIYVETPKVACSTIKSTLQKLELQDIGLYRENFEDIHKREFSPLLKVQQMADFDTFLQKKDIFKFCFVRNPYSRVLSAYLDKIVGNQSHKGRILLELGHDIDALKQEVSFEEFLAVLSKQTVLTMDPHWRVQYYQTFQDYIDYDFIGKFENFEEDFVYVGKNISDKFHKYYMSEKRHSTDANTMLDEYYTNELKEIVYNIYKKDFDYFGYKK